MRITSSTLKSVDIHRVIEEARDAELCRNLDLFRDILSGFWENIEEEPNVSTFDPSIRAELLRLCGVFLSQFGRARGLADHQNRAKDILSRAARLFEAQNYPDMAAETKVGLATCYWYSGEVEEHDAMLRSVEAEFVEQPDHRISIQIKLNRVLVAIWRKDREEADDLIDQIAKVISHDHDLRLRTQFHNLAGIARRMAGDLEQSTLHVNEAVRIAKAANNTMFVAFNLNNLAFVYRVGRHFDQARKTIDEALSIMESREDNGWIPHALDTKALIYLDQDEYDKALLRLNHFTDALRVFVELRDIVARQVGQVAVDKFEQLLAEEIYVLKHFPLADEVAALKRSLVVKAMRDTGGHVSKAALKLGLRSQQHLSDILNKQFPDIYDELGIKRRARRTKQAKQPPTAPGVTRLTMPKNSTYSFNFAWSGNEELQFFYFPRNLMREFGVRTEAVAAVIPVEPESLMDGGVVLYFKDNTFRTGRLSYDEFTELFLVDLKEFIFLSDVELIGVPIGYCRVSERNKQTIKFRRLQLVKEV